MRKKKTSRPKKSRGPKAGVSRNVLPGLPDHEADLAVAPRARLLDAARTLGLDRFSRLPKDALLARIRAALRERRGEPAKEAPGEPAVERPRPEHAARSHAEFQAHRFSLTEEPPEPAPPKSIPWGYGRDRVRALPVDPDRLYVYWEVTDEAIEGARRDLGPGGAGAWLSLRIYDTTGRLFDGTNAHHYFDHRIDDNHSRQWFFPIGRPGSDAVVEIGMKSGEGFFVRIARSGRVVFPRRSAAPVREPQWLTVRASREAGAFELAPASHHGAPDPMWSEPLDHTVLSSNGEEWVSTWSEWRESPVPAGEAGEAGEASEASEASEESSVESSWEASFVTSSWESGPFPSELEASGPVQESYQGQVRTFQRDGRTHVVFGPWRVVVRDLGAFGGRRVLSRWSLYRSWAVPGGFERGLAAGGERRPGSAELLGASERRFRGASELRLGGASELLVRGASERRFGGASERMYSAASEKRMGGASERRFRGASERLLGGASERRLGGASERRPGGPSEKR